MPGRPHVLVPLLAALALAAPALALEPQGTTIPWNTLGCSFLYATIEIPEAVVQDRVPAGWQTYAVTNTPQNPVTQLVLEADDCAEGSGIDRQLAPMDYASTWIPVTPPIRHSVGIFTVLAYDVLIPDDERRAMLASAGAPVKGGSVEFGADLREGKPLAPFSVTTRLDGYGEIRFDVVPGATLAAPGGGEFAQYTPGEDGSLAYWRTKWQATQSNVGVATITLPEESWQAQALGTNVVAARANFGAWDYFDGKIVVPS